MRLVALILFGAAALFGAQPPLNLCNSSAQVGSVVSTINNDGVTYSSWTCYALATGGYGWILNSPPAVPAPGYTAPQIAPSFTATGTTLTDTAPLGSELTSASGWTSTGWTGSYNSFTHTTGNTTVLTNALTGEIVAYNWYLLTFALNNFAGSVTASIGGATCSQAGVTAFTTGGITLTYQCGPLVTGTSGISFTPTTDFNGTVSAISVKQINPIATYSFLGKDSTGAYSLMAVQPLASLEDNFIGGGGTRTVSGNLNTGFGWQALGYVTTGSLSTALGGGALYSNTSGTQDTAVGVFALDFNTIGNYNTALGDYASYGNTSGNWNVSVGPSSLSSNQIGGYNVGIGGESLAATTASYNVGLGYAAGLGPGYGTNGNISGTYNTFLGYEAAPGSTTQQNYMTVLGASATATCSYCVSLGRQGTAANGSDVVIFNGLFTFSSGTGHPALPAASSVPQACAWISDGAASPAYMAATAGGGTTLTLTCSNGTSWLNH